MMFNNTKAFIKKRPDTGAPAGPDPLSIALEELEKSKTDKEVMANENERLQAKVEELEKAVEVLKSAAKAAEKPKAKKKAPANKKAAE